MLKLIKQTLNYIYISFRGYLKIKEDTHGSWFMLMKNLQKQAPNAYLCISDNRTKFIYRDDMERVGKLLNVVRFRKWTEESHDCDNFAYELKGIMSSLYGDFAFGIVMVDTPKGRHALNCYVDQFMKLNYYEPQNNWMGSFKDNPHYKPYMILI
jgi:hypothetical protein